MYERLIWLIPSAVTILGLWRPRAGLLVLAATLPFFGSPPGGPYLAALDVAALGAILTTWLRSGHAAPSALARPALAFVVVGLASLVPSTYQPPGWQPSVLVDLARALPEAEVWSALFTWRAAADLVLGWGLFLSVRKAFAGRSARPLAQALLAGLVLVLALGALSQAGLVDLGGFRAAPFARLHSVFFLSGWLAEYIVMATPPAIAVLATAGRWGRRLRLPLLGLALACIGLTLQRGAWVAAVVQVALWTMAVAAGRPRHPGAMRRAAAQAAVALGLAAVVLITTDSPVSRVVERGSSIESGLATRTPLWAAAVEMTEQRPILGWGLGSFAPAYDLAHPPDSQPHRPNRNTTHNLYLGVAAERGLLGLLSLALLGWTAALGVLRPADGEARLAFGLGVGLAGAAVYGLVQYVFHLKSIHWLFWLLLGGVALVAGDRAPRWSGRAAAVLLALALSMVPIRFFATQRQHYEGNLAFGFHELEGRETEEPYRWSGRVAGLRLPWQGETLILPLANGHPRAAERPVKVTVRVDGETMARVTLTAGWLPLSVRLGPPKRKEIVLTLEVEPTFRPFSDYRRYPEIHSFDIRSLGVALREPRWR